MVVAKISKVKLVEESDPVLFPSRDDTLLNFNIYPSAWIKGIVRSFSTYFQSFPACSYHIDDFSNSFESFDISSELHNNYDRIFKTTFSKTHFCL